MKNVLVAILLLIASGSAIAQQQSEQKRVDWRFAVGVTYMSGFQDVSDYYLDAYGLDATVIPVGASFNTTVQISHGSALASIPTIGVGPVGVILTKEEIYGYNYSSSTSTTFVDVPITASYGLKFMPGKSVGPYVRGGIAYHIASGDVVADSTPGAYGAAGIEFLQNRRVAIGVEAAYDSSTITFKGISGYLGSASPAKIKTGAALFSVRVVF